MVDRIDIIPEGIEDTDDNYVGLNDLVQTNGSVTISGGQVVKDNPQQVNTASGDSQIGGNDTVLATLRNRNMRPINDFSGDALDGATVEVDGIRMSVESALASGFLARDAQGNIAGTNQGQLVNAMKTENELTNELQNTKVVDSRPIPSSTLKAIEAQLGPSATHQQVSLAIGKSINGADITGNIEDLSRATGMNAGEVHTAIDNAVRGTQAKAIALLDNAGYEGKAMVRYLNTKVNPDVRASIVQRLYGGDASALNDIVSRFKLNNRN